MPDDVDYGARFLSRIRRTESGCWAWAGEGANGAPRFRPDGCVRTISPRRYAWECARGPVPDGQIAVTACGTSNCVRHLELRPIGWSVPLAQRASGERAVRRRAARPLSRTARIAVIRAAVLRYRARQEEVG